MYKFIFTLLILCPTAIAFADDQDGQVITLKDGSQIKGQLAGIDNGVYTVKTPIIGDVHVNASDVASITNANAMPAPALSSQATDSIPNMNEQIAAQQQRLIGDPQAMAMMQQMAQDPEVMQALQDPSLVQAVTSHDYEAVQANPKVQALMSNPKMQALIEQLKAQQQASSSQ